MHFHSKISCCTEKNIGKIVNESLSIISGVILGVSCHIIEINTLFNEEIVNNKEFIHIKLLIISGSIFFLYYLELELYSVY